MLDQRDISDKGGTMRLGAYYAVLSPTRGRAAAYGEPVVSERHRHRFEFNRNYKAEVRGGRLRLQRDLAGRAPGRVHRARGSPVLGRDAGPPRVQEPAGPPPPAVPELVCAALGYGASPRRSARCSSVDGAADCAVGVGPGTHGFRHVGDRLVHQGTSGASSSARSKRPTARFERDVVRSPGRRRRDPAAVRRGGRAVGRARSPVPRALDATCIEIPAGMRDVADEPTRGDRRARAGRGGRPVARDGSST